MTKNLEIGILASKNENFRLTYLATRWFKKVHFTLKRFPLFIKGPHYKKNLTFHESGVTRDQVRKPDFGNFMKTKCSLICLKI